MTVWNEKDNVQGGMYSMLSVSTSEVELPINATSGVSEGGDDRWFHAYDSQSLLLTILGLLGIGALIARRKLGR